MLGYFQILIEVKEKKSGAERAESRGKFICGDGETWLFHMVSYNVRPPSDVNVG